MESLANELLLDIFEFFDGVHLLRAFYGLNSRFDNLLFLHFRKYIFDFRFMSNSDFNIVCQQYLPLLFHRPISLRLSDGYDTPNHTSFFLSYNLTLRQFTYLQSLSLSNIRSSQTMNLMINELNYLCHVQCLNLIECYFHPGYFDTIWNLSKLTCFNLDISNLCVYDKWSDMPKVISLSLQLISIALPSNPNLSLERLFVYTPCLKHLSMNYGLLSDDLQLSSIIPSMEILKLSLLKKPTYILENLLRHMPNLCQLAFNIHDIYVDGYQWEKMITDYLPNLKIFRLMMQFNFCNNIDSNERVNQILASFQTRFWIHEHHWYMRCHWGQRFPNESYCLYTLPYTFSDLIPDTDLRFRSTCPNDDY